MERTIPFRDPASATFAEQASAEPWARLLKWRRSRLANGIAWTVIGSGFGQGGSFLSSLVLARILGRETFGQYALVQSTVNAFTCLGSMGLGLTATKYISEYRVRQPERIGKLIGLSSMLVALAGLCFSIALALYAPMLAMGADHHRISAGFRLSTVSVFFLTLTTCQIGILAGFENFRSIGKIGAIYGLAMPLLSWCGAVRFGMTGAIATQGASAALLWVSYEAAVRRECRSRGVAVRYRGTWDQRAILTRVSIPAAAVGMVGTVAVWGANAILARICGYAELALFAAAFNLRSVVMFLPALIVRVISPRLNYWFAGGDLAVYTKVFWGAVGLNGGLAAAASLLAFLKGQQFMHLFGKGFAGPDLLLAFILASVVVEVIANNLYQAVFASCRFWWSLMVMSLWMVLLLAGSFLAIPHYGATGLAVAYLAAWLLPAALYAAEGAKITNQWGSV
jgi:O-antigen/teichoic acid export membrane protein